MVTNFSLLYFVVKESVYHKEHEGFTKEHNKFLFGVRLVRSPFTAYP
jgi:hypothetical protein